MRRVVVIGRDQALTELVAAGVEASPEVSSCRAVALENAAPAPEEVAPALEADGACVVLPEGARGVPDTEAALRVAGAAAGASQIVLVSSAAVHEPNAHHPGLVREGRLPPLRNGNRIAASWRELEERFGAAVDASRTAVTVLRPAALVARGSRSWWSRLLAARAAFPPAGFDPTVQLLAGDDLAAAVRRAVERPRPGVYHVAPAGGIPVRAALSASRTWRMPVPFTAQWLARKALSPLGAAPPEHLDYLRYSWTVSGEKIGRDLGFRPAFSSAGAIAAARGEPQPAPHAYDDFGFDPRYVDRLGPLFRFLHDSWWRVEWRGLEHVPREGPAVLTGVHRGHQPWDGVMAMYYLTRELGRTPRFLVHPTLVKFPHLAPYMVKCGGLHASWDNASRVLADGELLAIFPEGIRGAFRKYEGDATYRLGRFGRDEYVKMALAHRAPIVPFVTVGSAEIFPILAKIRWGWWKRYTEWPCLPLTPTLGTVPLPSKWHTRVLEPWHVEREHPPEAAGDRATVKAISAEVKRRMQAALDDMLERRRSIFFGSIFTADEPVAAEGEA